MMDQRAKYSPKGLITEYIAQQTDKDARTRVLNGEVQLVFITPESLLNTPEYRNMLLSTPYSKNLVGIAVDEAHCVKLWDSEFRPVFSQIGDICSIVPPTIKIMALTATATTETYYVVKSQLAMDKPELIVLPPHRENIFYEVESKLAFELLYDELGRKRTEFPKTVIYVRRYIDCSRIYMMLKRAMGVGFMEPPGYPYLSGHRLVDMFTRVLTLDKKEELVKSFSEVDGNLRLVIATTAFGMGIDCSNIRQVMHLPLLKSMLKRLGELVGMESHLWLLSTGEWEDGIQTTKSRTICQTPPAADVYSFFKSFFRSQKRTSKYMDVCVVTFVLSHVNVFHVHHN